MKYIITNNQYELLKEYFDPLYFLKKKLSKDPDQIKPEEYIKYEEDFQRFVDVIFKITYKQTPLEHLNGFKVSKVTPSVIWTVLLTENIDDWFNYCKNAKYVKKLGEFKDNFKKIARMTAMGSPFGDEYLPQEVDYVFWSNC
jgi:hypothetical protein